MSIDQFLLSADTTDLNYPEIRPTLDLNFARTKTLDPRITFTRASGGSYVGDDGLIKYAGVNEARFDHNPVTGESLGLLIEEQRSNLWIASEAPDTVFYQPELVAFSPNSTIAPDGNQTADKIIMPNGVASASISRGTTIPSGATMTGSVFIKYSDLDRVEIVILSNNNTTPYARASMNPQTGEITIPVATSNGGTNASARVDRYPNGWYRFSVTVTYPAVTLGGMRVSTSDSGGSLGDDIKGTFVWGAQFEQGSFASSYIPTQGSTRTRTKEYPKISGTDFTNFYNPSEGTFYARYSMKGYYETSGFNRIFEVSDGGSTNEFVALLRGTNQDIYESGVWGINFNTSLITFGDFYTYIVGYKENDFQRYAIDRNGNIDSNTDTSVEVSSFIPTELNIGYQVPGDSRQLDGHISQLTYYPKRLPNQQLQALTRQTTK